MGQRRTFEEVRNVRCRVCGGAMEQRMTGEAELENIAMARVDRLLAAVDRSAELEVVRYAA